MKQNKIILNINKQNIYIKNLFCSININNIENYLKRIEKLKNKDTEILIVPNTFIYNLDHLNWSIFITKNKFLDKNNIARNFFREYLLTLSNTNQINKIDKEFFLNENQKHYFVSIVKTKKIYKKEIDEITKNLELKILTNNKFNKQKAKEFYKIKNNTKVLEQILEKIGTSHI